MAGDSARKAFLSRQGFAPVGCWLWDRESSHLSFQLDRAEDRRVVYAFLINGAPRYIGICEKDHTFLKRRMERYRSKAGGSTNKRIASEIEHCLKEDAKVEIWALIPKGTTKHKGLPVDLVKGLENPLLARMASMPGPPLWNAGVACQPRGIRELIAALRHLPSDEPTVQPGVWYKTQKEHWLGWLKEYDGPGYYSRVPDMNRTAEYAYNHIVEPKMLLYLLGAAGVDAKLVTAATRAVRRSRTMMEKSAAIRRLVPWRVIAARLWGQEACQA